MELPWGSVINVPASALELSRNNKTLVLVNSVNFPAVALCLKTMYARLVSSGMTNRCVVPELFVIPFPLMVKKESVAAVIL